MLEDVVDTLKQVGEPEHVEAHYSVTHSQYVEYHINIQRGTFGKDSRSIPILVTIVLAVKMLEAALKFMHVHG